MPRAVGAWGVMCGGPHGVVCIPNGRRYRIPTLMPCHSTWGNFLAQHSVLCVGQPTPGGPTGAAQQGDGFRGIMPPPAGRHAGGARLFM
jgi:hypothetical protein